MIGDMVNNNDGYEEKGLRIHVVFTRIMIRPDFDNRIGIPSHIKNRIRYRYNFIMDLSNFIPVFLRVIHYAYLNMISLQHLKNHSASIYLCISIHRNKCYFFEEEKWGNKLPLLLVSVKARGSFIRFF